MLRLSHCGVESQRVTGNISSSQMSHESARLSLSIRFSVCYHAAPGCYGVASVGLLFSPQVSASGMQE